MTRKEIHNRLDAIGIQIFNVQRDYSRPENERMEQFFSLTAEKRKLEAALVNLPYEPGQFAEVAKAAEQMELFSK